MLKSTDPAKIHENKINDWLNFVEHNWFKKFYNVWQNRYQLEISNPKDVSCFRDWGNGVKFSQVGENPFIIQRKRSYDEKEITHLRLNKRKPDNLSWPNNLILYNTDKPLSFWMEKKNYLVSRMQNNMTK